MAIVGDAYVIVRAKTDQVESDIKSGFNRAGGAADSSGKSAGERFQRAFKSGLGDNNNVFKGLAEGLDEIFPKAEAASAEFHDMIRSAYTMGTAFVGAAGGISAAIGGITALAATAAGAIASVVALGSALASIGAGIGVAKLALGGIGAAISKANKAAVGGSKGSAGTPGTPGTPGVAAHVTKEQEQAYQRAVTAANQQVADSEKSLSRVIADNRDSIVKANNDVRDAQIALNAAIVQGQEDIKQLGFDAEGAALDEKQASLDLQKARAALAAVQDLPPNSAARQAAELAYQEADLNLRKAKDASQQLNAEQARLAKTGVAGTQVVMDATSALADAQTAKSKAIVDALQSQADAQEALAKAQADAAYTKNKGPDVTAATKGTKGTKGSAGSGGSGGADPFAGLNQAQKDFAEFILSLKPEFDKLKEIAANSFLPPLTQAIKTLNAAAFPTVAKGVGEIGTAMGKAVISIADLLSTKSSIKNLGTIFAGFADSIPKLGDAAGHVFSAILTILAAAQPVTKVFTDSIDKAATNFDNFLNGLNKDKTLSNFFLAAGSIAADFGKVASNIFGIIGAIIKANFGPGTGGQLMLDTLVDATKRFSDFANSAKGQTDLKKFFLDVVNNALPLFHILGELGKLFIQLAASPSLGKAFGDLQPAIKPLGQIVDAFAKATPDAAKLVVQIVKMVAALEDSGAIKVFFSTLTGIAKGVTDLFSDPAIAGLALTTGRLSASFAALGFAAKLILGPFGAAITTAKRLSSAIGAGYGATKTTIGAFKEIGTAFQATAGESNRLRSTFKLLMSDGSSPLSKSIGAVGRALTGIGSGAASAGKALAGIGKQIVLQTANIAKLVIQSGIYRVKQLLGIAVTEAETAAQAGLNVALLANPIGLIVIGIAALVAGFILAYTHIKPFRDVVNGVWAAIKDGAKAAFDFLASGVKIISDIFNTIVKVIKDILGIHSPSKVLSDIGQNLVEGLVNGLKGIGDAVATIFNGVVDFFKSVFSTIIGFITNNWPLIISIIGGPIGIIIALIITNFGAIKDFVVGVFTAIGDFFTTIFNAYVTIITTEIAIIQTVFTVGFNIAKTIVTTIFGAIRAFISDAINGVRAVISLVVAGISALWSLEWNAMRLVITTVWNAIKSFISTAINVVKNTISSVVGGIKSVWSGAWSFVSSTFHSAWDGITSAIGKIKGTISNAFSGIKGVISGAFTGAVGAVKGAINGIIGAVNSAIGALNKFHVKIPSIAGVGGVDFGLNIPRIPLLAKGGVVQPSTGGTLVTVAEAGRAERVEPLDPDGLSKRDKAIMAQFAAQNSRGDVSITINAAPGQSETEIAAMVSRQISFQMRKGGI